jgi:Transcriptional regulator
VDEHTLACFLALCAAETTGEAAAVLGVHQSSVSRALSRLEAELGATLFTRHGRRLELNRVGAAFRADAAAVLQQMDSGRRHVRRLTEPGGLIRLGFLQSVARSVVPSLVERYRTAWPGARVELQQGFARELYTWIADDRLDVAVVTPPDPSREQVTWHGLVDQELQLAVPRGHRLASAAVIEPSGLAGEDFIAFSRTTEIRALIDSVLGTTPVSVAFESSELDTIRGLVAAGLGVAILPVPMDPDPRDPVFVPLQPPTTRSLGLAWSAVRDSSAALAAFLTSNGVPAEAPAAVATR